MTAKQRFNVTLGGLSVIVLVLALASRNWWTSVAMVLMIVSQVQSFRNEGQRRSERS